MSTKNVLCALAALLSLPTLVLGQNAPHVVTPQPLNRGVLDRVGIDQNLGAQVPPDAVFADEFGRPVKIGDLLGDRPAVLVLNYFACPQLCGIVLGDLSRTLKVMPTVPGKDFDVIAISFDPRDTPEIARKKRDNYVGDYERATGRRGTTGGWHFLTGRQPAVDAVCDAVGFRYAWDETQQQFAHAAGVIVLTPQGRVSRYFYGIDYRPDDLRLSLSAAAGDELASPVEKILLYCFAYDPSTGRYSLAIWRFVKGAAALTAVGLGLLVGFLLYRERRRAHERKAVPA